MREVAYAEETLHTPDGISLFLRSWLPVPDENGAEPRATVVICHGQGDHSGRYDHVARYFAQRGYAVYAHDHRGQGKSGGHRGHIDRFANYYDDLWLVIKTVKARQAGKKLFLIGHSLGGLIAIGYAQSRPKTINGLIASSPGLERSMHVPAIKLILGKLMLHIAPRFALNPGLQAEGLTHDPQVAAAYKADPIREPRVTARFYAEFEKAGRDVRRNAGALTVPSLIMPGGDDPICSTPATVQFYDEVSAADKTLVVWEGMYHEIFNEIDKQKVLEVAESWVAERLASH